MEQRLSGRVRGIAPSATMSIDAKTKALMKEGQPVVNMSVGEPDFDTPKAAAFAGIKAIVDGQTRYTPAAGTLELRKRIAQKLMTENGLQYTPEQIVVSSGAKHSLFNIFLAICDPGDEVILPAPYWVSYPEQIRLSGAEPVIVSCNEDTGFKMTPEQLKAAITPRTKAVMLNSPSNPTGAVYTKDELKALGEVLVQYDVYVVTDEIYERLVYNVEHYSLPALVPDLMNRTIVVNGFSKAFAMTGWRLGYLAGPQDVVKAVSSLQSHATGNPASISQAAGIVALDSFDPGMVEAFHERRDYLVSALQNMNGIQCLVPDGAFYVFPNISGLYGKSLNGKRIETSNDFCTLLLETDLVAAVPGEAFGAPENMRLSYATSMEQIKTAVERIERFISRLES
ncbi:pyridoxal phosphate-dependent aminotransferase [Alicyclobacillus ferrooxydans]|uniref:Aminotransferase n=1 Tax=Alicyclobacillus ferrooxydans TaxID=471514 RepID=A0A0P9EUW9_9BACL|nr:pyridoxal phosphate-dependent aminotransferase [Alicyclobacillus ferrooxydans]KPV42769.1 aspartate aminotransferase [Alicyclobacillus ferrooxydans]